MASANIVELNESNFDQEVVQSGTTTLVDFWAPWCGPCLMIAPVLEEVAAEYGDKIRVVKVNVDESPRLAAKYRVQAIPNLLFFKGGEVREQIRGVAPKADIVARVETLAAS